MESLVKFNFILTPPIPLSYELCRDIGRDIIFNGLITLIMHGNQSNIIKLSVTISHEFRELYGDIIEDSLCGLDGSIFDDLHESIDSEHEITLAFPISGLGDTVGVEDNDVVFFYCNLRFLKYL